MKLRYRSLTRIIMDESRRPSAWVWAALWLFAGVMIAVSYARADEPQWHAQVHGTSLHDGKRPDGKRYNARNVGLGLESEQSRELSLMAGAYRNSIDRTSIYALARWTPVEVAGWRLGAAVGAVTGYEVNNGGPTPVAAFAAVSPEIAHGVSVQLVGLPGGLHPKVTGYVGASVRIRF